MDSKKLAAIGRKERMTLAIVATMSLAIAIGMVMATVTNMGIPMAIGLATAKPARARGSRSSNNGSG